jgi:hypothetical protein
MRRWRGVMIITRMDFTCSCGARADKLDAVGLTSNHQQYVGWTCAACHQKIGILTPLADCWRRCPEEDTTGQDAGAISEDRPSAFEIETQDALFLHEMGVRIKKDGENE